MLNRFESKYPGTLLKSYMAVTVKCFELHVTQSGLHTDRDKSLSNPDPSGGSIKIKQDPNSCSFSLFILLVDCTSSSMVNYHLAQLAK
jgi:hypothetical protein